MTAPISSDSDGVMSDSDTEHRSSYFVDVATIRARRERDKERYARFAENFIKMLNESDSEFLVRQHRLYGVDNDFDLIEAMWAADRQSTGDLLSEPWFVKFRVKCAMRPEYTEKCLESRAFYDVRGRILRRLCLRPWRWPQLMRFVDGV